MARIIHPHPGFTGSVGPVRFTNGTADTDLPAMVDHFDRAGYEVHHDPSTPTPADVFGPAPQPEE